MAYIKQTLLITAQLRSQLCALTPVAQQAIYLLNCSVNFLQSDRLLSVWSFEMAFSTRRDELWHEKVFFLSAKLNEAANNKNGQNIHYGERETVQKITFESYFSEKHAVG